MFGSILEEVLARALHRRRHALDDAFRRTTRLAFVGLLSASLALAGLALALIALFAAVEQRSDPATAAAVTAAAACLASAVAWVLGRAGTTGLARSPRNRPRSREAP